MAKHCGVRMPWMLRQEERQPFKKWGYKKVGENSGSYKGL
jgi:hypothetical protein